MGSNRKLSIPPALRLSCEEPLSWLPVECSCWGATVSRPSVISSSSTSYQMSPSSDSEDDSICSGPAFASPQQPLSRSSTLETLAVIESAGQYFNLGLPVFYFSEPNFARLSREKGRSQSAVGGGDRNGNIRWFRKVTSIMAIIKNKNAYLHVLSATESRV